MREWTSTNAACCFGENSNSLFSDFLKSAKSLITIKFPTPYVWHAAIRWKGVAVSSKNSLPLSSITVFDGECRMKYTNIGIQMSHSIIVGDPRKPCSSGSKMWHLSNVHDESGMLLVVNQSLWRYRYAYWVTISILRNFVLKSSHRSPLVPRKPAQILGACLRVLDHWQRQDYVSDPRMIPGPSAFKRLWPYSLTLKDNKKFFFFSFLFLLSFSSAFVFIIFIESKKQWEIPIFDNDCTSRCIPVHC